MAPAILRQLPQNRTVVQSRLAPSLPYSSVRGVRSILIWNNIPDVSVNAVPVKHSNTDMKLFINKRVVI